MTHEAFPNSNIHLATTVPCSNGSSFTMTIARHVGTLIKKMNETDAARVVTENEINRLQKKGGDIAIQIYRSQTLENRSQACFRQIEACHDLMTDLPANTLEEAAALVIHASGFLETINCCDMEEQKCATQ